MDDSSVINSVSFVNDTSALVSGADQSLTISTTNGAALVIDRDLNMNNFAIKNLKAPVDANDAVRKSWVEANFNTSDGDVSFSGTLNANLYVSGDSLLEGSTTINDTLLVSGATTLASNLTVEGNANMSGATTLQNILHVNDDATLQSSLYVSGDTTLNNNLDIDGNLLITGTTTLNGPIRVNTSNNDLVFSDTGYEQTGFNTSAQPLAAFVNTNTDATTGDAALQIGQLANGGVSLVYNNSQFRLNDSTGSTFFEYDYASTTTTIDGDLHIGGNLSGGGGGGGGGGSFSGGEVTNATTFQSQVNFEDDAVIDTGRLFIYDDSTNPTTLMQNTAGNNASIRLLQSDNTYADLRWTNADKFQIYSSAQGEVVFENDGPNSENTITGDENKITGKTSVGNLVSNSTAYAEAVRDFNIIGTAANIRMSKFGGTPAIEWRVWSTSNPSTATLQGNWDMFADSNDVWNLRCRNGNPRPIQCYVNQVRLNEATTINTGSIQSGYQLTVNGNAYATGSFVNGSDSRIKRNIVDISENEVRHIMKNIQTKKYKYSDEFRKSRNMEDDPTTIGFIAQEIKELIPEAIDVDDFKIDYKTGEYKLDNEGEQEEVRETLEIPEFHFLKKDRIFAVGMEGIKLNMRDIENLQSRIQFLEQENFKLRSQMTYIKTLENQIKTLQEAVLKLS